MKSSTPSNENKVRQTIWITEGSSRYSRIAPIDNSVAHGVSGLKNSNAKAGGFSPVAFIPVAAGGLLLTLKLVFSSVDGAPRSTVNAESMFIKEFTFEGRQAGKSFSSSSLHSKSLYGFLKKNEGELAGMAKDAVEQTLDGSDTDDRSSSDHTRP